MRWAGAALLLAALVGCSTAQTVDIDKVEATVASQIHEQTHRNFKVSCPSHIDWKVGSDFHCIATNDYGDSVRITVTMENDDGDVTWEAN